MNINQFVEQSEKRLNEIVGDVPESAIMKHSGKEFCIMCGHPNSADKVVKEIKSYHSDSLRELIGEVRKVVIESKVPRDGVSIPLHPYLEIVEKGNFDDMYDYGHNAALDSVLQLLDDTK